MFGELEREEPVGGMAAAEEEGMAAAAAAEEEEEEEEEVGAIGTGALLPSLANLRTSDPVTDMIGRGNVQNSDDAYRF